MRLRALQGDRAGALRVYHTCATTLQRELGVEPGPATQQAYEDLTAGRGPARAGPGRARRLAAGGARGGVGPIADRLAPGSARAALGLLLGEAGIGKTRLVEELLDWARRQGISHAYARCYAAEGELAYAPGDGPAAVPAPCRTWTMCG